MAARYRRQRGGYRFRRFAGAPHPEIQPTAVPRTVRLKTTSPLTVKVGQAVRAGQIVAQGGTPPSSPVLCPVNGTVKQILAQQTEVVIEGDGTPEIPVSERRYPEWRSAPREHLEDALYLSGITGHAPGGIPTRRGSSRVGPEGITEILVEATYSDVWNPSLTTILDEARLVSGLSILRSLLPMASATVVVDRSERRVASRLASALSGVAEVVTVPSRYPLAHEAVLVPSLLGRRIPAGAHAADVGVLILDLQTAQQVHEVIVEGKPPLERIVALAGTGFERRPHLRVRLGAPIAELAKGYLGGLPSRLVINSPVSGEGVGEGGRAVDAATRVIAAIPENHEGELVAFARPGFGKDSYSKTFVANLLPTVKRLDTNLHGEGRACISCGFCEDVCPADILPQLLHRYVKKDMIDETLVRYRLQDCIDCNLCTYVCPSKIPVAELMAKGKARLAEEGLLKT